MASSISFYYRILEGKGDAEHDKSGDPGDLADLIFGVYPWVGPLEAMKCKNFKTTTYHRFLGRHMELLPRGPLLNIQYLE